MVALASPVRRTLGPACQTLATKTVAVHPAPVKGYPLRCEIQESAVAAFAGAYAELNTNLGLHQDQVLAELLVRWAHNLWLVAHIPVVSVAQNYFC
jgi:hypothetical protein